MCVVCVCVCGVCVCSVCVVCVCVCSVCVGSVCVCVVCVCVCVGSVCVCVWCTYGVRVRGVESSIATLDVDDLTIRLKGEWHMRGAWCVCDSLADNRRMVHCNVGKLDWSN